MSEKEVEVGRRRFLEKVGSAAVGGGILAACGAGDSSEAGAPAVQTSPRVQWRMASAFPRGLDAIFGAAERGGRRGFPDDGRSFHHPGLSRW